MEAEGLKIKISPHKRFSKVKPSQLTDQKLRAGSGSMPGTRVTNFCQSPLDFPSLWETPLALFCAVSKGVSYLFHWHKCKMDRLRGESPTVVIGGVPATGQTDPTCSAGIVWHGTHTPQTFVGSVNE